MISACGLGANPLNPYMCVLFFLGPSRRATLYQLHGAPLRYCKDRPPNPNPNPNLCVRVDDDLDVGLTCAVMLLLYVGARRRTPFHQLHGAPLRFRRHAGLHIQLQWTNT